MQSQERGTESKAKELIGKRAEPKNRWRTTILTAGWILMVVLVISSHLPAQMPRPSQVVSCCLGLEC